MPRITERQINRANVDAANPEEYFRRTIYIPVLDALISYMISCFGKQHEIAVSLSLLVPKQVVYCDDFKTLEDSTRFFTKIISDFNIDVILKLLKAEVSKWRLHTKCTLMPPITAIDVTKTASYVLPTQKLELTADTVHAASVCCNS